jgi:excisionase family DNA binding protein
MACCTLHGCSAQRSEGFSADAPIGSLFIEEPADVVFPNDRSLTDAAACRFGGAIMTQDRDRPLFGRQSKVMTVEEVSEYLHVHPSTIYRLIKRNKIPAFRIGSDWRFNVETIDKWRAEMEGGIPTSQKGRS